MSKGEVAQEPQVTHTAGATGATRATGDPHGWSLTRFL